MTDLDSIQAYDYELPKECIAQTPSKAPDQDRLLVLQKDHKTMEHRRFFEVADFLKKGDLLVLNDTKVFRCRLFGRVGEREIEVFLLRALGEHVWEALLKPGKLVQSGTVIHMGLWQCTVTGEVVDGVYTLTCTLGIQEILQFCEDHGRVPIPPYITHSPEAEASYQTEYAQHVGSVAAPTAGLHVTSRLLEELRERGVGVAFVTLHVGIGTFRPVKVTSLHEHEMHPEWVSIQKEVVAQILATKAHGGRVIAVGTTVTRTLEGIAEIHEGILPTHGFSGFINTFIRPGFSFRVIDGLITNFHLPKSTLFVLVCAFMGRETMLRAYREAIEQNYRFFSFGDAMLLLRR